MNLHQLLEPISEFWIKSRLSGNWRGVRFLCYHGVSDQRRTMHPAVKHVSVTTKEFRDHLAYFHSNGLPVVSIDSAVDLLESGDAKKGRYVCLTFDDGDMNNYTHAWQILNEFGLSAHFFVVADFVGKSFAGEYGGHKWVRNFMGEDELGTILKGGGYHRLPQQNACYPERFRHP